MSEYSRSFPDHNQNYWQLGCIQASASGLPVIFIGGTIASHLGVGSAISYVIIGNLLLWMIGLTIISMDAPARPNALELVKSYLGTIGGVLAALFLIIAFLSWYTLQLHSATIAMNQLLYL